MLIDPNAPRYAASNKVWVFGSQTWSDAIQIPECDVEYSRSSATEPICYRRTSGSTIRFVYNFPYVNGYTGYLCSGEWRVPRAKDFDILAPFIDYDVLSADWGYSAWPYFERGGLLWSSQIAYDPVYTALVTGAYSLNYGEPEHDQNYYVYTGGSSWNIEMPIRCVKDN
jgi:hypothetical protein